MENNVELPIIELYGFIFSNKKNKFIACQNLAVTTDKDQITIIIDKYHKSKAHTHCSIDESIRRI